MNWWCRAALWPFYITCSPPFWVLHLSCHSVLGVGVGLMFGGRNKVNILASSVDVQSEALIIQKRRTLEGAASEAKSYVCAKQIKVFFYYQEIWTLSEIANSGGT